MAGGINFDEGSAGSAGRASGQGLTTRQGMIGWIVTHGLARNERAATTTLAIVAGIAFVLAVFFFMRAARTGGTTEPSQPLGAPIKTVPR